jgi:hypothetical protein
MLFQGTAVFRPPLLSAGVTPIWTKRLEGLILFSSFMAVFSFWEFFCGVNLNGSRWIWMQDAGRRKQIQAAN